LTAGVAVAAGVVLAIVALTVAPVAGSLRAAAAWPWLLAVGCVVASVATHHGYPAPRLGVPDAPSLIPQAWWSGRYGRVAAAIVLGLLVAATARWGGASRGGVAVSGLAGPALIAV